MQAFAFDYNCFSTDENELMPGGYKLPDGKWVDSLRPLVKVIAGRAFALTDVGGSTLSQDGLVGMYVTWNGVNELINQSFKIKDHEYRQGEARS